MRAQFSELAEHMLYFFTKSTSANSFLIGWSMSSDVPSAVTHPWTSAVFYFTKHLSYDHPEKSRKSGFQRRVAFGWGGGGLLRGRMKTFSLLVSWYSEPSQPQRIISGLNANSNLSPIYSAGKSSDHKCSKIYRISPHTYLYKTKHTYTNIKHNLSTRD